MTLAKRIEELETVVGREGDGPDVMVICTGGSPPRWPSTSEVAEAAARSPGQRITLHWGGEGYECPAGQPLKAEGGDPVVPSLVLRFVEDGNTDRLPPDAKLTVISHIPRPGQSQTFPRDDAAATLTERMDGQ